ncbi:hypothetical protein HNY73_006379 [Argiope bruennichi]|uniref:Uncharacterized protein n=1 Tax=Argiope bruennichi TaxID=94029 RepID=A0A8T0FPZ3_ARGBR|nr:hypothetical protein HNY73_006379 [Argiope bruennichi]
MSGFHLRRTVPRLFLTRLPVSEGIFAPGRVAPGDAELDGSSSPSLSAAIDCPGAPPSFALLLSLLVSHEPSLDSYAGTAGSPSTERSAALPMRRFTYLHDPVRLAVYMGS